MYYGALTPNTAFTKEATRSYWSQGFAYLRDFADPYHLWIVALLVAAVIGAKLWGATRERWLLVGAPVAAGLVYGFFVVRGGADHMHGRMLLPVAFALLLLGLIAVPFITRAWASRRRTAGADPPPELSDEDAARVDEELRRTDN